MVFFKSDSTVQNERRKWIREIVATSLIRNKQMWINNICMKRSFIWRTKSYTVFGLYKIKKEFIMQIYAKICLLNFGIKTVSANNDNFDKTWICCLLYFIFKMMYVFKKKCAVETWMDSIYQLLFCCSPENRKR